MQYPGTALGRVKFEVEGEVTGAMAYCSICQPKVRCCCSCQEKLRLLTPEKMQAHIRSTST